jgi:hypothetical protein
MWPECGLRSGIGYYREATQAECEAHIAEIRESYREDVRTENRRHAENIARIRKHRDDLTEIWMKRLSKAAS